MANNLDACSKCGAGAILRYVDSYVYTTWAPGNSAPPSTLSGKQRIYYFTTGTGTISAAGDSAPVSINIAVLVAANLAFTIKNTGTVPLGAYVITEPTPSGFQPGNKLVVKDEKVTPISVAPEEWSRLVRPLFTSRDGLATISSVETVTLDNLTITRPFTGTVPNTENLWMELSGTSIAFIGPYLRRQTPGIAYEHPPDNLAPTGTSITRKIARSSCCWYRPTGNSGDVCFASGFTHPPISPVAKRMNLFPAGLHL